MNELNIFNYEGNTIRTIQKDGEPWWVLVDLCNVLEIGNSRMAADRLDDDEKAAVSITDTSCNGTTQSRNVTVVSESGLYHVILLSRKPEAKRFKRWVTHEVLPAIRKHGLYATPATIEEMLRNPDNIIRILTEIKETREKNVLLAETVIIQNQQISEMKPKASYYDVVLNCKDAVAITTIAKDYGKSGQWLNEYLHNLGVQFKMGDIWLLYQKYAEKGYTCTKTHNYPGNDGRIHSKVHTYWTQKGRLFIYDQLKTRGWLPLIEQGLEFEAVS